MQLLSKKYRVKILDRNAISLIKDLNNNIDITTNSDSKELLKKELIKLKNTNYILDKITITPLLSILEGQTAKKENYQEAEKTIEREANQLKIFFGTKKTDSEFLKLHKRKLASAIADIVEVEFENYLQFIKYPMCRYFQPLAHDDIIKEQEIIYEKAKIHNLSIQHPIFIATFALIHGSQVAREVIKPKKKYNDDENLLYKKSYNVCSDLLVPSRINLIDKKILNSRKTINYEINFVTNDEYLKIFLKWFIYESPFNYRFSPSFPEEIKEKLLIFYANHKV